MERRAEEEPDEEIVEYDEDGCVVLALLCDIKWHHAVLLNVSDLCRVCIECACSFSSPRGPCSLNIRTIMILCLSLSLITTYVLTAAITRTIQVPYS